KAVNRSGSPVTRRASDIALRACRSVLPKATQSAIERTLWPTSRPTSQRSGRTPSTKRVITGERRPGCRNRRSTSECGDSSRRPCAPRASTAQADNSSRVAGPRSSATMRQARPTTTSTTSLRPCAISRPPSPNRCRFRSCSASTSRKVRNERMRSAASGGASPNRRSACSRMRFSWISLAFMLAERGTGKNPAPRRPSIQRERARDAEDQGCGGLPGGQERQLRVADHPSDGEVGAADLEAVAPLPVRPAEIAPEGTEGDVRAPCFGGQLQNRVLERIRFGSVRPDGEGRAQRPESGAEVALQIRIVELAGVEVARPPGGEAQALDVESEPSVQIDFRAVAHVGRPRAQEERAEGEVE